MEEEGYDFEGTVICVRETPKAILVLVDGDERWIPKSVIHDDSEVYTNKHPNNQGKLIVKMWWAVKEGIFDPD